jgi:hypothetical protein
VREKKKKKKKKQNKTRGSHEGEVGCFVLILICVFFDVSACEWRTENALFLYHPYNSCSLIIMVDLVTTRYPSKKKKKNYNE